MKKTKLNIAIFDKSENLREILKAAISSHKKIENVYLFGNFESLTKFNYFSNIEFLIITAESLRFNITNFKKIVSDPGFITKIILIYENENQLITDLARSINNITWILIPSLNKFSEKLIADIRLKLLSIIEKYKISNHSDFILSKLDNKEPKRKNDNYSAVFIGVSMGGPKALRNFLPKLLRNVELPVIIVQHIMEKYSRVFVETLNHISPKKVILAQHNMIVKKNTAYVAPGGIHIEVGINDKNELKILHNNSDPEESCKPSIKYLFRSAAKICKDRAIAVILTGMGKDGSDGIIELSKMNAYTIAQDKKSCEMFGMPLNAIKTGCVDKIISLDKMADYIKELVT